MTGVTPMLKSMLRRIVIVVLLAVVLGFVGLEGAVYAQSPTPPPTFFDKNNATIIAAVIALISGVFLSPLLTPIFRKLGEAIANIPNKLGAGWGFKKRYLTHLVEEYKNLNIRGLRDLGAKTNAVELEHVYVSLQAGAEVALGRQSPPITVGRALAQHRRLVILGGPGSGKTTLMAYLTLTYARRQVKPRLDLKEKALPIFVPLRQLKQVLAPVNSSTFNGGGTSALAAKAPSPYPPMTFPAYLTQYYAGLDMHAREGFFKRVLDDGRCLILLDGLDEVADEGERRQLSEWVDQLVTLYPKNRYIVTSRPPGYESAPLTNGFAVLRVRDFAEAEIRQFAQNWCLAVELAAQGEDTPTARRRAGEAARDLVAAITANAAIRKLAVNPLLLSIIALVHRYRATLPKRRVDLYDECVDVLLGHWDAAKGLAGTLAPGAKRAILQPVALALHRQGQREIRRRDLERLIAAVLPTVAGYEDNAGAAAEFLDEVRVRSGLLVENGVDTYTFSHLTFQEYLCAREIAESGDRLSSAVALPAVTMNRTQLYRIVDRRFDEEELRTLCFRLGLDYDDLPGRSQGSKARELVALFDRRGQLTVLADAVEQREDIVPTPQPVPEPETPYTLLLRHADEEWWQEVFLLYAGMTDATPLIKDLTGFPNLSGLEAENRLLLAGRCVAEAARLDPHAREVVQRQLEEAFATCTGDRFVQVGQVLAEIAGEDSVGFFLRVAHEDAQRRDAALGALAEMARQPNETLRERVVDRLIACFHEGEWQQTAGAALLQIWGVRLAVELRQRQSSASIVEKALGLTMVRVPAGEFLYGDSRQRKVLPEFWIDRTPVTHGDYKQFIDANPEYPVPYVDSDWTKLYNWDRQARTFPPDKADHPVVLVSWHDAVAYADWAGKTLPTEEEWKKAARGTDGRAYPWGNDFDKSKCNTSESGIGGTTPVGRYSPQGDSPYGCADMAGNVWEWTASDWSSTSKAKVLRGGSWSGGDRRARAADRNYYDAGGRNGYIGFRCRVG